MFSTIKSVFLACFSKSFYEQSASHSTARRLLTLFVAGLILWAVVALFLHRTIYSVLPWAVTKVESVDQAVPQIIPDGQEFTLDFSTHTLSSTITKEHRVDIAKIIGLKDEPGVIVFDPAAQGINPGSYDAQMLIGPQGISVLSTKGSIEYRSYKELFRKQEGKFVINQKSLKEMVASVVGGVTWLRDNQALMLAMMLLGLCPVVALLHTILRLITLTLDALIAYFVLKAFGREMTLGQAYRLGIYVAVPVLVVQFVSLFAFPFWAHTLLFVGLMFLFSTPAKTEVVVAGRE